MWLIVRSAPPRRSANGGPISLIDFSGDFGDTTTSSSSTQNNDTGNLLDDLAGLSFQSKPVAFGQGGSISLGHDTSDSHLELSLILGMFSSSPSNTPLRAASPQFHQAAPVHKPVAPDYSAFSSLQQSFTTPRVPQQSSSELFASSNYTPPGPKAASRPVSSTSIDDDFGTFASAVQEPSKNTTVLCNSSNLNINLEANRSQNGTITLTAQFSNKQPLQIDGITFQMAVPKVLFP
jgi:Adaptin C-terminal domain